MVWRVLAIAALFLSLPGVSKAQEPFVEQRETNPDYDEGDWISYSIARFVTSIAIGRQYIYFGTRHSGITRYDQFKEVWDFPWTLSNGLVDNSVQVVAYDFDTDFLWCATHRAVSYYNPTARKWRNTFKAEMPLSLDDEITSIGIDNDNIYFETKANKYFSANKYGSVVRQIDEPAGSDGLIKWYGARAGFRKDLPNFFMTDGYLFGADATIQDPHFRTARITATAADKWGHLWIGTWGLGAGKADLTSLRLEMLEFGLNNQTVGTIALADDVLWLAGSTNSKIGRGITAWDFRKDSWQRFEPEDISQLRSDQINQVTYLGGDDLWFSTDYGLARYSRSKAKWRETIDSFDGLGDNVVFDAIADETSIWVATRSGLSRIDKGSLAKTDSVIIERINHETLSVTQIRDLEFMGNLLWAATSHGVYVYDTIKKEGGFVAEVDGPFSSLSTSISVYGNEVWFGSQKGIDVFDYEKRQWLGVPEGRVFPDKYIHKILAGEKAVWAATSTGLLKYSRDDRRWRTFTMEDGLLDDRVYSLLLDGQYIWIGTHSGLTQFYWDSRFRID